MEILSNIGFDWQVALINFLNFLIIFWILKKYVFPKISKIISERKEFIEKGVKDSEEASVLLSEVGEKKDKIIKDAKIEASEYVKKSQESAKSQETVIVKGAKEKAGEIIEKGVRDGEDQKSKIIDSAQNDISKLAILATEKILREK